MADAGTKNKRPQRSPDAAGSDEPGDSLDSSTQDFTAGTKLRVFGLTLFAVFVVGLISAAFVAQNDPRACLSCHVSMSQGSAHRDLRCWDCHDDGSAWAKGVGTIRIAEMGLRRLGVGKGRSEPVDDAPCARCHAAVQRQTVSRSGIRVRHADFWKSERCLTCHAVHSTRRGRPVLDRCSQCHNEAGEDTACPTCHVGAAPKISASTGWLRLAHNTENGRPHGPGGTAACNLCHRTSECRACHGVTLPHGELETWRLLHGKDAKSSRSECLKCHMAKECDGCHRTAMPHAKTFLSRHPSVASGRLGRICLSCHVQQDCDRCHSRHVHAHMPARAEGR